jgi:hypothetical protein
MSVDQYKNRLDIEYAENWPGMVGRMPFIEFPAGWSVSVIPPFGGLQARFRVLLPSGKIRSIYADFFERAGYFGEPYWEVYPYRGDVGRCRLADTSKLLRMIGDESEESSNEHD